MTQRKCKGDLTLVSNMLINSQQFFVKIYNEYDSLLLIGCALETHPHAATNQNMVPEKKAHAPPTSFRKENLLKRSQRLIFYNNMCQLSYLLTHTELRQAVQHRSVSSLHLCVVVCAVCSHLCSQNHTSPR